MLIKRFMILVFDFQLSKLELTWVVKLELIEGQKSLPSQFRKIFSVKSSSTEIIYLLQANTYEKKF